MFGDEADTLYVPFRSAGCGNFGLTIWAADLSWSGNDYNHSQGNNDYEAHAHVYEGGADPLGSQGFAGIASHPSSS
jgi:hypothetical protein